MYNIEKVAIKFIKHDLHGRASLKAIINYLQKIGYTVLFFSDTENLELLSRYNLLEYSKGKNAFTVNCKEFKAVFLNKSCTEYERLCAITHEAAHIKLGHLSRDDIERNNRREEMEAEAFAYMVLSYKPQNKLPSVLIALCILCCGAIWLHYYASTSQQSISDASIVLQKEMVYITSTGNKFHRSTCIYTKDKDCATLTRDEAIKTHNPCMVCNP